MITFTDNDLILVTGASSGMGRATALLLNSLGARVIGIARNEEKLKNLVAEAQYPKKMLYAVRDLSTDFQGLSEFVKNIVAKHGKISGLVNCAGIIHIKPFRMEDYDSISEIFNTNFFATILLTKEVLNKRNRQDKLSVVMVSSISSLSGEPALLAYSSSKGAVNSVIKSLAAEYGRYDVRINAVIPGNIEKMIHNSEGITLEDTEYKNKFVPVLSDCDRKQYVANTIAFLLSDISYWITGQSIVIDGGETL